MKQLMTLALMMVMTVSANARPPMGGMGGPGGRR